jgi:hypothetical protein
MATKQISAPVGTVDQEFAALSRSVSKAKAQLGEALALSIRNFREHVDNTLAAAGSPQAKATREKAGNDFLGLPGLVQTVANQGQARQHVWTRSLQARAIPRRGGIMTTTSGGSGRPPRIRDAAARAA